MTGVSYTVTFQDIGIEEALSRLAAGAADMTPLMDDIGSVLVNGARERISTTNESPDGVPWPKSFRVTVGQGGKTLYDSGALMNSITEQPAPHEVTVGSNMIYAGVHQAGATIRPKTAGALAFSLADGSFVLAGEVTIPARPYLGISEEDGATIEDVTAVYFAALMNGEVL